MSKNPRKISLIGSRATSVLSVTLVLIIVGLCGTLGVTVHRASQAVGNDSSIMITIVPGQDPLKVSELKRTFKEAPWVNSFDFSDAKTVLAREVESMDPITREGLEFLPDNPFGDEFTLHIADGWRTTDSISRLCTILQNMEGVDIVSADASAIGKANAGVRHAIIYLIILAFILLIISIALINNTISLSIYSRRFNIHTMKLVGATNAFIRRPFVRAGALTGLIAGFFAACVVCGLQTYLMVNDTLIGPWITPDIIGITAIAILVLGTLLARAAAWCAATNYLKKSYDLLFKK